MSAVLRQIAYVAHLARVRLLGRPAVAIVAVAGVALGAAAFTATVGGGLVVRDRNVGERFERLPPPERSVQATHLGVVPGGHGYAELDTAARRAVTTLAGEAPARAIKFKELRLGSERVLLAAADDAGRFVTVEQGRLPHACNASRCELFAVQGRVTGRLPPPFVLVGSGRVGDEHPLGSFLTAGTTTSESEFGKRTRRPVLFAGDTRGLSQLPALASIYRTYAWLAPLEREDVRVWEVGRLASEAARARNALRALSDGFELSAPVAELLAARHAGNVADTRLRLVGGETAALLLAFAVFLAATMRRREQAAWRRLTWFGARRWQILLLATLQAVLLAGTGVVAGWGLGVLTTALVARSIDLPAADVVREALLTGEMLAVVGVLTAAAALALLGALLSSGVRLGGRSFTAIDMAAVAALGALVLVLALDRDADGGSAALLLAPGLALFVAAYVVARVLAPLTRTLQRLLSHSAFPLRLASLSIARAPGQAVVAAAFLVVSVGLAVFTLLYLTTLRNGIDDQAAYGAPADFLVQQRFATEGLVTPLGVAGVDRYRSLAPGTTVTPVLREHGSASDLTAGSDLTVLGVPAESLPGLDGWRGDFADVSAGTIADRLEPPVRPTLRAVPVPRDATELTLPVRVTGDDVEVIGAFIGADGRFLTADFGRTRGPKFAVLHVPVSARLAGSRLLGIRFRRVAEVEAHAHGGGPVLRGALVFGRLAAQRPAGERTLVSSFDGWTGVGGVREAQAYGPNGLFYFVSESEEALFRLRQPTDEQPLAAAVSPDLARLAAGDGTLAVHVPAGTVPLRIVATVRHFPSVLGPVVVVDRDALAVALHALQPGAGAANELWLDAPSSSAAAQVGRALAQPPFDALAVESHAALKHSLDYDPLTRGTILLLVAALAIALLLGLLAVLFLAETDVRDGQGELLDLETQGAEPRALRRHLRLRLLLVAVPGVLGGALAGLALSRLVVEFVELTLTADVPEPPLLLDVDWALLLLTLAAFLAAAAAVAVLRSRSAFRAAYAGDERA